MIPVNRWTTFIPKRYLFYDIGIEITSLHKSYFFTFKKKKNREKLLTFYADLKGTIVSEKDLKNLIKVHTERWMKGQISNFTYLMHLNNFASRSFNDLSQYYVFPWTVSNFDDNLNQKFLSNSNNFRPLNKPVGRINESRFV